MSRPLQIVPLGTNGFLPSFGRQTMSFLLETDAGAVLLDAGSGTSRLLEPDIAHRVERQDRLDIVLSHYHLDHTCGLTYLNGVWGKDVRIYAPAPPLVDAMPQEAFDRLIAPPVFPMPLSVWPHEVEIVEYTGDFQVAGLDVTVRRQRHPGGSAGMRFGDAFAYTTDTAADPETVGFVRGTNLLIHEVWLDDEEAKRFPRMLTGHAASSQVLEIAQEAGVARLAPVHFHPKRPAARVEELLADMASQERVPIECFEESVPVSLATR